MTWRINCFTLVYYRRICFLFCCAIVSLMCSMFQNEHVSVLVRTQKFLRWRKNTCKIDDYIWMFVPLPIFSSHYSVRCYVKSLRLHLTGPPALEKQTFSISGCAHACLSNQTAVADCSEQMQGWHVHNSMLWVIVENCSVWSSHVMNLSWAFLHIHLACASTCASCTPA